jgi:hypothetical protein
LWQSQRAAPRLVLRRMQLISWSIHIGILTTKTIHGFVTISKTCESNQHTIPFDHDITEEMKIIIRRIGLLKSQMMVQRGLRLMSVATTATWRGGIWLGHSPFRSVIIVDSSKSSNRVGIGTAPVVITISSSHHSRSLAIFADRE